MSDFESFQSALETDREEQYMGSLNRSLSLVMDEFYGNISSVGVSAATGEGISELFHKIDLAGDEFNATYLVDLQR